MSSYKSLLCPYFLQGTCNYGDGCIYSHKPEESVVIPPDVCIFYLRSNCMNSQCRRRHATIDEIVNQPQNLDVSVINPETKSSDNATINVETFIPTASTSNGITSYMSSNSDSSKSYAAAASSSSSSEIDQNKASIPLCSYFESNGFCVYPHCPKIHGNYCDLCGFYSVHPYNQQQSDQHRIECIKQHEESMEISFAYQRSKDLTCAICLDVVLEKEPRTNRRFGILENCIHIYCIECIRRWRNAEEMDKKNKRNCPQCRIKSDFIIPSEYFYDDKEQKGKLIENYKKALGSKHCRYFNKGKGKCPFLGACFYKHEYPDGTKADLPKPTKSKMSRVDISSLLWLDDSFFDWEDALSNSDSDSFGDENFDNESLNSSFGLVLI